MFDLSDHIRPDSQTDIIATQTFDVAANSRRPDNSQIDSLATQVLDSAPTMHENSSALASHSANSQFEPSTQVFDVAAENFGSSPLLNSCAANSQTEPATQVFDALPTMQQKSNDSNSQTDDLQTQVFCEPVSVAPARRSGSSPQESTQTFSAPVQPRRSSAIGKDGSRISFSPDSCSTQVFPAGESDFPHLTLEMSECNDNHNDSYTAVTPAAVRVSLQQVGCLCLSFSLHTSEFFLYYFDTVG